jgi:hypothetical protein
MQSNEIHGQGRAVGVPKAPSHIKSHPDRTKGIFGLSRKSSTHGNRSFAPKTQCHCVKEAEEIWTQIGSIKEVSFDAIFGISEQVSGFWSKSQECQLCPERFYERLLEIYGKLVDFFEGAIVTYTSFHPPDKQARMIPGSSHSTYSPDRHARPSSSQNRQQDTDMSGTSALLSTPRIVCVPSAILLGDYEIDEQQSRYLALDLVRRKLKGLAVILYQMLDQEKDEIVDTRSKIDAIFSRVLRLLSTV